MSGSRHSFGEREQQNLECLVASALAEDLGQAGDITSKTTIPGDARGAARLVARSPGCWRACPRSSCCPESLTLPQAGRRTWPTAITSSRVAWSGAWRARCRRSWRWSVRRSIFCSD